MALIREVPISLPAENHIPAGPRSAVPYSSARVQPQAEKINGLNPASHFTLSQAIANFYQAPRFRSREFSTDHAKAGTHRQRPLHPPATSSCFISTDEQQEQRVAVTAQHRGKCFSRLGLGLGYLGDLALPLCIL